MKYRLDFLFYEKTMTFLSFESEINDLDAEFQSKKVYFSPDLDNRIIWADFETHEAIVVFLNEVGAVNRTCDFPVELEDTTYKPGNGIKLVLVKTGGF